MKRLILFSGGVESTALLLRRNDDDIVVTVEDTSPRADMSFHPGAVKNIAAALNVDVRMCQIFTPIPRPKKIWHYQLWMILPVVSLCVTKDPSICEVWYGVNASEYSGMYTADKKYTQLETAWNILHPGVPIVFAMVEMTKAEIWNTIPNHIRPLVRTCIKNTHPDKDINCGTCRKCLELKMLPGSCLYEAVGI